LNIKGYENLIEFLKHFPSRRRKNSSDNMHYSSNFYFSRLSQEEIKFSNKGKKSFSEKYFIKNNGKSSFFEFKNNLYSLSNKL